MTARRQQSLSPRERILSLAAVIAAAFGVGLCFGIGFPLSALTFEAWGEQKWMIGLVGAAPAIAVLVALPFLPRVVARLDPVAAIVGGCMIAAIGFVTLAFLSSSWLWLAVRVVMSAGLALPWLIGETWINTVAREETRGRVISIYAMAFFAGFSSGPLLLDHVGLVGYAAFLAGAVGAAFAGIPILLARNLAPDFTHDVSQNVFSAIALAPAGMMAAFIAGFAEVGNLSLIPNVAIAAGRSEQSALTLLSILTLGGVSLQFVIGWLADKTSRLGVLFVLAFLFIALALLLPWALPLATASPIIVFLLGGVVLGFYTIGLAVIGERVAFQELAAANAGFLVMYQTGAILGPLATGVAMTAAPPIAGFVATMTGLMAISIVLLAILVRVRR
jgi:MFS family permease